MNFAAQFFYSSYLSERLERFYSPKPALTDCVENDPFWQRWETAADPDSPDPVSPDPDHADPVSPDPEFPVDNNPVAAALTPYLPKDNLPPPLNLDEQQDPTINSRAERRVPQSSSKSLLHRYFPMLITQRNSQVRPS
ncbi:hypothetical protein N1851_034313 [Merluccius polli]|uniref:Uncharacterized protein n=1 Tax=Merluccius polli TaxID=89951 RepID=A0AA47LZU9_MERPO|nr:hypothetical protein N1851_034313 [Merluccius polli]